MTEAERKSRIAALRAELRELESVPRSDWHAGFEAMLRIETHRFGDRVQIRTEHLLGEEPPRADFVVLIDEEGLLAERTIFRIFRKHNILEYKNPHDALNERVLRKGCGYANLYIGTAEHEGDVPPDQVTLSIFRANRPERLFRELAERGQLTPGNVKGIYRVNGLLDIPVQIVITGELEGPEYAACRALTDRAAVEDVEQIIQDGSRETDFAAQEHYRVLLGLVARKNPEVIEEIRRYEAMEREWTDIFKDVIDERINNGIRDTTVACIRNVMESFGVSEERAMESLKIPQNQRAAYADLVRRA